jgi:hypothetical protein
MWSDENTIRPSDTGLRRTSRQRLASVVSPHSFAGAVAAVLPLFQERYEQQDAQEFLRVSHNQCSGRAQPANITSVCFATDARRTNN